MNKVSKQSIEARIANVEAKRLSAKITHVTITMVNGFEVTGESACVDPKNYDFNIGKQIAYDNAFEKLWMLEGYLLQDTLYTKKMHILSEADEAEYLGMKEIAHEKREYAHKTFPMFPAESLAKKIETDLTEAIEEAKSNEDPETVATLGLSNEETEAMIRTEFIAKACHEANRVWCEANNDYSQVHWEDAEQWQKDSAIKGVEFKLANPDAGEDAQHNAWMADKIADGWVYGEEKDAEKKTHYCLVPFNELPEFQQKKDRLFQAIVNALK